MDLSAIIFVVLALAWAVYLIPKALKHHDDLASDRLVEGHSDKVRILSRTTRSSVVTETTETLETAEAPTSEAAAPGTTERVLPTRAAARSAAKRRRRVLALLLLAAAVVSGLAWFAIVPWWSTAIPGGLVLLFLVVARLSVRAARRGRGATTPREITTTPASALPGEASVPAPAVHAPAETPAGNPADLVERLGEEDTVGLQRQELEAALADDGSLWDPLPMTLPTYVNKARARRTVRTIELTGINSSGHDQADTALAREAQESAQESAQVESEQRRVVGG